MYDVVIVGGSFAGLATAQALRGHRVLLLDRRPIGAHQTSTCAIPLPTMQATGAESAMLEVHDNLVLHTAGRTLRYPLPVPYATFNYYAFCQAMLARTDAEVWITRATGVAAGSVLTGRGPVAARFVVDATGWQGLPVATGGPTPTRPAYGYGIETELSGNHAPGPGLHFYFEKDLVRSGYAWAFGCGATTRLGICTFTPGVALGPLLVRHLARFGLQAGHTHGGVIAFGRRDPVATGCLRVGDAAGGCLPLTAEGIRPAILSGILAGQALNQCLTGTISAVTAHTRYRAQLRRHAVYHANLRTLQETVAHTPDALLAATGRLLTPTALIRPILQCYLAASGGLTAPPCRPALPISNPTVETLPARRA